MVIGLGQEGGRSQLKITRAYFQEPSLSLRKKFVNLPGPESIFPPPLGIMSMVKMPWAKACEPKVCTSSNLDAIRRMKGSKNASFAAATAVSLPMNLGASGTANMKSSVKRFAQPLRSPALIVATKSSRHWLMAAKSSDSSAPEPAEKPARERSLFQIPRATFQWPPACRRQIQLHLPWS